MLLTTYHKHNGKNFSQQARQKSNNKRYQTHIKLHVPSGKCMPTHNVEHTFVHGPPLFKRPCWYRNIYSLLAAGTPFRCSEKAHFSQIAEDSFLVLLSEWWVEKSCRDVVVCDERKMAAGWWRRCECVWGDDSSSREHQAGSVSSIKLTLQYTAQGLLTVQISTSLSTRHGFRK